MGPWCARLRGFVSVGRDVYRLFRCKLWPCAIEFATPRRAKVFGLRVQGRIDRSQPISHLKPDFFQRKNLKSESVRVAKLVNCMNPETMKIEKRIFNICMIEFTIKCFNKFANL